MPAFERSALCVPKSLGAGGTGNAAGGTEGYAERGHGETAVRVEVHLPKLLKGGMRAGTECGAIEYAVNGVVLQRVPLVCERTVKRANAWTCAADFVAQRVIRGN